jgi:hypothetical protein
VSVRTAMYPVVIINQLPRSSLTHPTRFKSIGYHTMWLFWA